MKKGRVATVTDTIPGSNPFVTSITYDSKGRKSTVTHPSAITETYGYNQYGYLNTVIAGGATRWTTTGINARGQVTAGTYGSSLNATMGFDTYGFPTSVVTGTIQNYSFNFNPVTGNLAWRQNNKYTGLKEDFQYDNSDRLSTVTKNSVTTLSMSYDGNTGGLTGKSDAGTFSYDPFERPYAIESIYPTTGLVPDSTQTIGYTSFNKVESISENGYEADLIYGSDDLRSRMIVKQDGNTILTRWYTTGSYVKETSGGVTKEYTFIGGDAYTAPVVAIKQSGSTVYYSILRDHLGSITHVVSSSGSVVAEYSYDAWGRMRDPATWTNYEPGSEPALMVAGRGFTGHEHLPWFNMINMNGRLYDPLTGMFLSPDNYVQEPGLTQNYNRYTYCLNNPLKYTDPGGYEIHKINSVSINPKYWASILEALNRGGIDEIIQTVPHQPSSFWWDDATDIMTFWIEWTGQSGRISGNSLSEIQVYAHQVNVKLSKKEFESVFMPRPSWKSTAPGQGVDTPWMPFAIGEIGTKENEDRTNSKRIIEYFDATELKGLEGTKNWGWCSAFANWVMKQAGYIGTNSGKAESWLNWGMTLSEPYYGCITVTLKDGQYHVGFYSGLGAKDGAINLLGGNQTNQVMYQKYYYYQTDVVRYAWPLF